MDITTVEIDLVKNVFSVCTMDLDLTRFQGQFELLH